LATAVEAVLTGSTLICERAGDLLVAVAELADPLLSTGPISVAERETLAVEAPLIFSACPGARALNHRRGVGDT
jgi:hypothetical protein